jgi:alpha-galactosidase
MWVAGAARLAVISRSSGDISDKWASMSSNGFKKHDNGDYAGPGGWNDPDMLEVGN